jgi:histone deacetylase 8
MWDFDEPDEEDVEVTKHISPPKKKTRLAYPYKEEKKNRKVGFVECPSEFADALPINEGRYAQVLSLIESFGLLEKVEVLRSSLCKVENLCMAHSAAYVKALAQEEANETFGLDHDCHPFPGLLKHCQTVVGATLTACAWLQAEEERLVVSWVSGRHHARREQAAGYCFVNDVAIGIELLKKRFERILYFDMDVHPGDGVEEMVKGDESLLYVSIHLYERGFFPFPHGAPNEEFSNILNIGQSRDLSDEEFLQLLTHRVIPRAERFDPDVILLQMGADALMNDPLGGFKLTPRAYVEVVQKFSRFNASIVVMGGGGYHYGNTAICWAKVTHACLGLESELPTEIPDTDEFFLSYGPTFTTVMK